MIKPQCLTCAFRDGQKCRRFPPQFYNVWERNNYEVEFWHTHVEQPMIEMTDWCGEYKPLDGLLKDKVTE